MEYSKKKGEITAMFSATFVLIVLPLIIFATAVFLSRISRKRKK